ncbi:hypothetical protein KAX06_07035 [candidate division WOR-3 bacterium]|nr:hypothetical protein [candidate division WOR-3 bacterium]
MPEDQKLCPFRMIGKTEINYPRMCCMREKCEWWSERTAHKQCIIHLTLMSLASDVSQIKDKLK